MKTAQQFLSEAFKYDEFLGCLRYARRPRNHFHSDEAYRVYNNSFADMIVGMTSQRVKGAYINFEFLTDEYIISVLTGQHADCQKTDLKYIRIYDVM